MSVFNWMVVDDFSAGKRERGLIIGILFFVTFIMSISIPLYSRAAFGRDPLNQDERVSRTRNISVGTGKFTGDFSYSYPIACRILGTYLCNLHWLFCQ